MDLAYTVIAAFFYNVRSLGMCHNIRVAALCQIFEFRDHYAILKDHIADFRYLFFCFIIENGLTAVAYCWLFVMQDL